MEIQNPAYGIMQTGNYEDAKTFLIACDCGDIQHGVYSHIEVETENDNRSINLNFFVNMFIPYSDSFIDRIKTAWKVLTTGTFSMEHTLILKKQTAINLCSAINESIKDLENT
jgi:hypothetical protein